jgi:hypothetical protein
MNKRAILSAAVVFCAGISFAGINDGLVAYYPLDGNAMDASTNGAHGSNHTGTVTYVLGKNGQAAWFDGASCILLPQPRLLDGASNATLSVWINSSGGAVLGGQIIGAGDSRGGFDPITTRINGSMPEDVHFADIVDTPHQAVGLIYGEPIPGLNVGAWHLFTMVVQRQATQSVFRCYLDTSLIKQSTNAAFSRIAYDADMPALIGAIDAGSPWQFWKGGIDDVRIYNRALSEWEVGCVFNGADVDLTIEVSQVRICWDPRTNSMSQLQYRSSLTTNEWVNLGAPIPQSGSPICVTDDVAGPRRFYRVVYFP